MTNALGPCTPRRGHPTGMGREEQELETREVRVDDPALPDAANRALTEELREVVGADEVEVPVGTPRREHDVNASQRGPRGFLGRNRLLFGITGTAALVVGAILALVVKEWWVLFIPMGVHAIGTLIVGFTAIQMTTQPESLDPALTAKLEGEGVKAPERAFNDLVEEFTASDGAGAEEVISTGDNAGDANAGAEPGKAAAQQRTAMTPAHDATEPAGDEDTSIVMGFQWAIIVGLAVTSVIAAFIVEMGWLLPVVMLPVCGAWAAYQIIAKRRSPSAAEAGTPRAAGPVCSSWPRWSPSSSSRSSS